MVRRYRMTAARRAALRKAQLASAKKRRRNRIVKTTAGVLGVTAAAAGGNYANKKVVQRRNRKAFEAFMDRPPAITRGKKHIRTRYNLFVSYTVDANGVGRGNAPRPRKSNPYGGWKVKPGRLPYYVKRLRPGYDADRRNSYDYAERRRNYLANSDIILSRAKARRNAKARKKRRDSRRAARGK